MSEQKKDAAKGVTCEPCGYPRIATQTQSLPSAGAGDPVNHPAHYTHGGSIECIDAIRAMLGEEGYRDFLRGTIVKYQWRMRHKGNMVQDAAKAKWYSDRLAESLAKGGK